MEKLGLIKLLGLPDTFGQMLLALTLIATLTPYASGKDFGVIKVPDFPDSTKRVLRFAGPAALAVAIFLFLPLWSKPQSNDIVLSSPFGDRQILLNSQHLVVPVSDFGSASRQRDTFENQKYLFRLDLPSATLGFQHELIPATDYAKRIAPNASGPFQTTVADVITALPLLRNAVVFRVYSDKPIRIATNRDSRLGPQAPPEDYKAARNEYFEQAFRSPLFKDHADAGSSSPPATSEPDLSNLDKALESLRAGSSEEVIFFNELSILIVDRKQFERTLLATQDGRIVEASPLAFLLSAGGTLPAFDEGLRVGFKGQALQSSMQGLFKSVQPSADGRVMDAELLGNLPQPISILAIGKADFLRRPGLE